MKGIKMAMVSLRNGFQLARNMGGRYVAFRILHAFRARTGLLRRKFPLDPSVRTFISFEEWKNLPVKFFFEGRTSLEGLPDTLSREFHLLTEGTVSFFSSTNYHLGHQYDWLTNPDTGFRYPGDVHWTEINDFNREAGDIKFVWEKSRFTFLYTIIRYDAYSGEDHGNWVFKEILSWINANPVNCGPNYVCSQEISLRVLNWTFAINYYKHSAALTEEVFEQIMHAIYWQVQHVYDHINFSRIAVRNNHAITETLALYVCGLLYPFFPQSRLWNVNGKRWFEKEIAYQIYEDGSFLQFSFNYQRVVVQLLSWAIRLSELNGDNFNKVVYQRAEKCFYFLCQFMDVETGWLPNYGANDGALFFPLSSAHFRDYRPQLEALSLCLKLGWMYGEAEEARWLGFKKAEATRPAQIEMGCHCFDKGGFYLFRLEQSFTFIRCGNHKDRPAQADNLHLDVWHRGVNLLHDGGSYKYNTTEESLRYFAGTASHNSVMLSGYDQMEKGTRFIWYHWTQCEQVILSETEDYYYFEGKVKAFQYINKNIRHKRILKVYKKKSVWEVEDFVLNKPPALELNQIWHTAYPDKLEVKAKLRDGRSIDPKIQNGLVSHVYGTKDSCTELIFSSKEDFISTQISVLA
jgi:hypothetical protein